MSIQKKVRDLEMLMRKHNHIEKLQEDDLGLLLSRFDKDCDGVISINEFFDQLEPHSHRQH